jgi:cell division septal protein FtsQ
MARKRKKKGKKLRMRLAPVLWLLFLANLGLGIVYSPITSLRKVRVIDAIEQDEPRLRAELASMNDVPFVLVNPRQIETKALQYPDVAEAAFSRNLFGSGILRIGYKTPVAVLEADPEICLSDRGELYPARVIPEGLPRLRLHAEATAPTLAYASTWEAKRIAEICKKISGIIKPQNAVIDVNSGGVVCLNMDDKGQVILGDATNLDEKLAVLKSMLDRQPNLLSEFQYLNVTSPSRPALGAARGTL